MSCGCSGEGDGHRHDYQYAAKVVVGVIPEGSAGKFPLPEGNYFTKINIHNPSRCDCVTFKWKVAEGKPGGRVGPISAFRTLTLCPDEALELVNNDMFNALYPNHWEPADPILIDDVKELAEATKGKAVKPVPLPPPPTHFEGWLVIETPEELDVVAVYATSEVKPNDVNTFHTERVPCRKMVRCENLYEDISTGVAKWEFLAPGANIYQYPAPSTKHQVWTNSPTGSVWVSPHGDGFRSEPLGDYIYRLKFKLCTGFLNPKIDLSVLTDDSGAVFLNNVQKATGTNYTTIQNISISSGFKAGENVLELRVNNNHTAQGIALKGIIDVKGGKCPGCAGVSQW